MTAPLVSFSEVVNVKYQTIETIKTARNRRKALLQITDGQDKHSRYSFSDIKEFVKEQDVQILAIGIVDPNADLTSGENGRAITNSLAQISGWSSILPRLRGSVGRHPQQNRARAWERVRVGYHSNQ